MRTSTGRAKCISFAGTCDSDTVLLCAASGEITPSPGLLCIRVLSSQILQVIHKEPLRWGIGPESRTLARSRKD